MKKALPLTVKYGAETRLVFKKQLCLCL